MSSVSDRWCYGAALAMVMACRNPTSAPSPAPAAGDAAGAAVPTQPVQALPRAPTITRHPPSVVVMDEPKIDLPKQESFTLVDAGKPPRTTLRYTLAAASFAFNATTTLSSRRLLNGGFTPPAALPAIRDGFAVTIAASPRGQVTLRGLPGEAAAPSAEADDYLAAWRTLLQNRTIAATIDARGAVSVPSTSGPADASARDELVQRLLSTIVPLPAEPIGAGASWRVVTILRQRPGVAKQTATYTLTARTATGWKLHVKLQRVGEQQAISDPSLPPSVTAELLAMFRLLEGDVEVDPRRPLISAGSLTVESRLHVKLQATGQAATEQMFEDTGTIVLSHSASPNTP